MMQDGAPRWKSVNAGGTASINGLPAGAEQVQTEATSAMGAACNHVKFQVLPLPLWMLTSSGIQ